MRILFVTAEFPYPLRRGLDVIAHVQLQGLCRNHEVTLISEAPPNPDLIQQSELDRWCKALHLVDPSARASKPSAALKFLKGDSLQVSLMHNPVLTNSVKKELARGDYDAAIVMLARNMNVVGRGSPTPKLLHHVDPSFIKYRRTFLYEKPHKMALLKAEVARLERFERSWASEYKQHCFVSAADADLYRQLIPEANTSCLPHAVDTHYFAPNESAERIPGRVVLTGNMFYAPNVDATLYFASQIWPIVRQSRPDATLYLVGSRPAPAIEQLNGKQGITVTGFVPDIRPYVREAMVSVCPVRLELGTQTKVLEAMALGTPVVTTSFANAGLRAVDGEHLWVADEPLSFANRTLQLLNASQLERFSQAGRDFVLQNNSLESTWKKMDDLLAQMVS